MFSRVKFQREKKPPVNDPCIYCGSSFDNSPGIIFLALSIWSPFTIHPAAENSSHYLVNNLAECFLQFTMNSRQLLGISVGFMNRNKDFVNLINCFIHASLQKEGPSDCSINSTARITHTAFKWYNRRMKRWLRHHCGVITSFLKMYPEINGLKSSVTPEIKSLLFYTLLLVIRTINTTNPGIF